MKQYLRYSQVFLLLSALTVLLLGAAVLYCDKVQMHLWLNGTHTAVEDFFWRYYTCVGEWVPYVVVALLLFYKAGWASFLLVDVLLSGGIGQAVKYMFNTDRPYLYFSKYASDIQLQFVEGVRLSEWYSFPSGHTITFFALFMTLAIICCEAYSSSTQSEAPTSKLLSTFNFQLSTFLLALAGAYSRIYLNQHFAEDIVGGIIIGVGTTVGLLFIVPRIDHTPFWNWNLLQRKHQ